MGKKLLAIFVMAALLLTACATGGTQDEELKKLETLFGDIHSWYNHSLTSEYASAEEVNLLKLFYCGFSDETTKPTDAEWAELKDRKGFQESMDFFRLPEDKMEEVLKTYFGTSLKSVKESGFEGLTYLESTQCYYFMTTGTNVVSDFHGEKLVKQSDGTLTLHYTAENGLVKGIVTVLPNGDGYRIISNRFVEA